MKKRKLLVIDDEADIGELVSDFLGDYGYDTYVATEARKGLKLVVDEKPDVVLLDIRMPEVGGLECLKLIKEAYPETVVIMVSGIQEEEIARRAIQLGAYDYVTKPFNLEKLQSELLSRVFSD